MAAKGPEKVDVMRLQEIRDFSQCIFDFMWDTQKFNRPSKFTQKSMERFLSDDAKKSKYFSNDIGNAVRVTSFILRDYFCYFYYYTTFQFSFKDDVKKLWSHWITRRDDVYVKVIDTIAILALAFLHRDLHEITKLDLDEANEWFVEIFTEHLELEFFKNGGWKHLKHVCHTQYANVFSQLNAIANINGQDDHLAKASKLAHDCNIVHCIRNSIIHFPVSKSSVCNECMLTPDKSSYCNVVYVRVKEEYEKTLKRIELGKSSFEKVKSKSSLKEKPDVNAGGTHPIIKGSITNLQIKESFEEVEKILQLEHSSGGNKKALETKEHSLKGTGHSLQVIKLPSKETDHDQLTGIPISESPDQDLKAAKLVSKDTGQRLQTEELTLGNVDKGLQIGELASTDVDINKEFDKLALKKCKKDLKLTEPITKDAYLSLNIKESLLKESEDTLKLEESALKDGDHNTQAKESKLKDGAHIIQSKEPILKDGGHIEHTEEPTLKDGDQTVQLEEPKMKDDPIILPEESTLKDNVLQPDGSSLTHSDYYSQHEEISLEDIDSFEKHEKEISEDDNLDSKCEEPNAKSDQDLHPEEDARSKSEEETGDCVLPEDFENISNDLKNHRMFLNKLKNVILSERNYTAEELDQTNMYLFSNTFSDSFQNFFEQTFLTDFKISEKEHFNNSIEAGLAFLNSLDEESLVEPLEEEGAAKCSNEQLFLSQFQLFQMKHEYWFHEFYFVGREKGEKSRFKIKTPPKPKSTEEPQFPGSRDRLYSSESTVYSREISTSPFKETAL